MRKLEKKVILLILLLVCTCFLGGIINHSFGDNELKMVYKQELLIRELTLREQQNIFLLENVGYERFKKFTKIFQCESGWEQTAVNLKSNDFGLGQVNEKIWDDTAKSMGLNYKDNWEDNILMSRYIQDVSGWSAWNWSIQCHHIK